MDTTPADSRPRQAQQPPQVQPQPVPASQQHHQQPQQTTPQQQPQQQPKPHHNPQQPIHTQSQFPNYSQPSFSNTRYTNPYHQYAYSPAPAAYTHGAWNQPPQYSQPALYHAPLHNMVTPYPQANVPQQQKRPAQPTYMPTHNPTPQAANALQKKEPKRAILKDPETGKEIDLASEEPTSKPSEPQVQSKAQAQPQAPTQPQNRTQTPTPPELLKAAQTLLQKVSEEDNNSKDKKSANDDPERISKEGDEIESQSTTTTSKEGDEIESQSTTTTSKEGDKSETQSLTSKDGGETETQPTTPQPTTPQPKDSSTELSTDDNANTTEKKGDKPVEKELTYEPEQYHPTKNKEGRRKYTRQFLFDIYEKIQTELQQKSDLDALSQDGNRLKDLMNQRKDFFAPVFNNANQRFPANNRQNDSTLPSGHALYGGRNSQNKARKIIPVNPSSLTQEVELKKCNDPWKPSKEKKEDEVVNDEAIETELLKKKFRSILNKLTPNNFESLSASVTKLNIDTEPKLGEVIDIVFAKALSEPTYCVLYGQMCSHLMKITAGTASFGNTLLRRCQVQFLSDIYAGLNTVERQKEIDDSTDAAVKKQLSEELYDDMYRCRMRGLGLIKFIGELYKIGMLNSQIMFDCMNRLLKDPTEESIECLCDLLITIGEKLEKDTKTSGDKEKSKQNKLTKTNTNQGKQYATVAASVTPAQKQQQAAEQISPKSLEQVFEQLHKIRKNKESNLSTRIRFKLLDTCELREKDKWHSKKTKDNNPKKLAEVREEMDQERRRQQNILPARRSQEGKRGMGHVSGSSSQISSLANESGGFRGSGNLHTSSSSHLIRDPTTNDNMKSPNNYESDRERIKNFQSYKQASFISAIKNISAGAESKTSTDELRPSFRPSYLPTASGNAVSAAPKSAVSSAAGASNANTNNAIAKSASATGQAATTTTAPTCNE